MSPFYCIVSSGELKPDPVFCIYFVCIREVPKRYDLRDARRLPK